MTQLVRAACLTNYVEVARSAGLDPWWELAQAGLSPACIDNPELRVSVEGVCTLLEQSATRSQTQAFGLQMAEGRRLSNLGALGLLTREEPNLRRAMESFSRWGRLHNEALLQRVEEAGDVATIYCELSVAHRGPLRQSSELVVAVAMRLMKVFLGADWHARRVCFAHDAPADLSVHRRVLGQSPEFRCEFNGIVCSRLDLDTSIPSADPVMADYIRRRLVEGEGSPVTVTEELRQTTLVLLPKGRCTTEQVARLMGINRRTLHRHLAAEGTTFTQVVQEIKTELARRYVAERKRPLTETSQLLGFADLSSFSRWHKSTFGQSAERIRMGSD